jgi:protoporphyrinogen oxidase
MAAMAGTPEKIAVIGGGIQGLSLAYFLSKRGHRVTLFERGKKLGGLLGLLEVEGTPIEGFYHHWFTSHTDILDLVWELGLEKQLLSLPSRVGTLWSGRVYPFTTALDLLRFRPLPSLSRIRLGAAMLFLRLKKDWRSFERVSARAWLTRYAGRQAWEIIWEPLLRGKFGGAADDISMAWVWGRIHERMNSRGEEGERLLYPRRGFRQVIDRMAEEVQRRGGDIKTGVSIETISVSDKDLLVGAAESAEPFGRVFVTTPVHVFLRLVPNLPEEYRRRLKRIRYRGAHSTVLVLKRPLIKEGFYWVNVADRSVPLLAVIEHTNLVPREDYGNKSILYLGNYPDPKDPLMELSDSAVLDRYLPHLKKLNPEFRREWVEQCFVFRDGAAQPIVDTHYRETLPPLETPVRNLYLVTMAQIYPYDRGTSNAVRQAKEAVERLNL